MGNEPKTKVWVVSIADAKTRRNTFSAAANFSDWQFFDAHTEVKGALLYDKERVAGRYGRVMGMGELGCYSSHYAVWEWLLQSEFDQMIVLEDDVVADGGFIDMLKHCSLAERGIEYLRLFAKMPAPWRFVASPYLERYRHLIRYTGYALGTQAYAITRRGAERFIESGRSIEAPVDVYMDRTWAHGVLNLALYPFPVYERFQPSSIGEERFIRRPDVGQLLRGDSLLQNVCARVYRKTMLAWARYGLIGPSERRLRQNSNGKFVSQADVSIGI